MGCRANVQELFWGSSVSWCHLRGGGWSDVCTNGSLFLSLGNTHGALCCQVQLLPKNCVWHEVLLNGREPPCCAGPGKANKHLQLAKSLSASL